MNADSLRKSPNPEMGAQWLEIAAQRQMKLEEESALTTPNSDMIVLLTESLHWAEREAAYHLGQVSLHGLTEESFGETA